MAKGKSPKPPLFQYQHSIVWKTYFKYQPSKGEGTKNAKTTLCIFMYKVDNNTYQRGWKKGRRWVKMKIVFTRWKCERMISNRYSPRYHASSTPWRENMLKMSHPNPSNTSRMLSRQLSFQRHIPRKDILNNSSAKGIKILFASKYSISIMAIGINMAKRTCNLHASGLHNLLKAERLWRHGIVSHIYYSGCLYSLQDHNIGVPTSQLNQ